jgi:hypothetical protein
MVTGDAVFNRVFLFRQSGDAVFNRAFKNSITGWRSF